MAAVLGSPKKTGFHDVGAHIEEVWLILDRDEHNCLRNLKRFREIGEV